MKSDKILDKCIKLSIDNIIADKIKREDRENNWIPGITKKRKMAWIKDVYLMGRLCDLRRMVEIFENELLKKT